jgi:hypothetical protein
MSNYPPGFTQGQHDRVFADGGTPNVEDCYLCGRQIEQDDDSRLWFDAELGRKPCFRSDWLDSFETQAGWICSTACWNDYAEEVIPTLFLVKDGAA